MFRIIITVLMIGILSACSTNKSANNVAKEKKLKAAEINIQLGMGYLQRNDTQRAKRKLLFALEQGPKLPEAWYSMGYFLESTGDAAGANKYYLKALEIAPKRGDVQNNYGTYLCRRGDYKDAIKHFELAIHDKDYLDQPSAYENAGLCALKIPDRTLATHYFKLAVAHDSNRKIAQEELVKLKKEDSNDNH